MIHNIHNFFVRKKVYFIIGILLLFFGRPSISFALSPIAAVCGYALLWFGLSALPSFKQRLFVGWLSFFLSILLSTLWLLSHPYSYIYAVWILLAALFSFPFALLSAFLLHRSVTLLSIVGFSFGFALLERSFTLIACGFPFLSSALYLTWSLPSLQLASVIGEMGLAFLVYATNLLFLRCLQKKEGFFFLIGLILAPYVFGSILLWKRTSDQKLFDRTTPPLHCAIVHMEEPPDVFAESLDPQTLVTREWNKVFSLLKNLPPASVDLIVLPEGVVPYAAEAPLFPFKDTLLSSLEVAKRLASQYHTSLILGLEGRGIEQGVALTFNSCYFVPQKGSPTRYDKQLLLPLGEYIPSVRLKKVLAAYGVHDSFSPGKEPLLFSPERFRIAPFICYEEIFAAYTHAALTLNPSCFVSISNDNWFPTAMLSEEHFALARLRAVEAGRPLIRSCNMGVSAAIDALGRVIVRSQKTPTCLTTSLSLFYLDQKGPIT